MSSEDTSKKAQGPEEQLKQDVLKPVKDFVRDASGSGKVDLQKVQIAINVMRDAHNIILDAAAKQLAAQKLA